jgi:hypothetical protein
MNRRQPMTVFEQEVINRLTRVESKLVRGFEELGVNINSRSDWLTVDDPARTVFISTLGRSLTVMLNDMARAGASQVGKEYEIVHKGDVVGTVIFQPIT